MTYLRQRGPRAVSQTRQQPKLLRSALLVIAVCSVAIGIFAGTKLPNPLNSRDATGTLSTYSTAGGVDQANPFFQSLGTNGRTCASCHVASDAWSITPPGLQARFNSSQGLDPVFAPVDGANCPSDDVSTLDARQAAYSQLLNKGLIRISLPMPASAAFSITQIQDPYNCAQTTTSQPAMYRRPLPSTNLDFLSAVMFDGRETVKNSSGTIDLNASLTQQATDATLNHAQATAPPTSQQLAQIVAFETALYTAQANDVTAGNLSTQGGQGGPLNVSTQPFYIGINDALGGDPTGAQFNPKAFTIYNKWASLNSQPNRQAVARGQTLFNTFPIAITGVGGLNDALGQPVISGTCTTCHDSPNVGNHSFSVPLNIGTTAYPALSALDVSGLPVYTVQCTDGTPPVQVTDIGRAMISGKCADIGKVKGPILRGVAGRAPYFHNGAAATLNDAVEFYNLRFNLNLTDQQKSDLVAFLQTL
jgi:cytochrome c peroxidase